MPGDDTDSRAPEDRFKSLADPTRLSILAVLARAEAAGETPLPYSTLQERVGVRDNGRLNYHLNHLAGHFVARRDGRYRLRPAGRFAHLVAVTSAFDETAGPTRVRTETDCHDCGATLVATDDGDGTVSVDCPACDATVLRTDPSLVRPDACDSDAFLDALDGTVRERRRLLARGLCPWCRTSVETAPDESSDAVTYRHHCETCSDVHRTRPGELLLDHPAVVAFHRDHGVALAERRVWTLPFAVTDRQTSVQSHDPWRVAVRIPLDGTELVCRLDDDATVRSVDRETHLRGI